MTEFTKEVELLASRDSGSYTVYVFRDIITQEYIMCTRLPRWQVPEITVGETGFLQYRSVEAGETTISPLGEIICYKYTNSYFINFVPRSTIVKNKEIIL